MECRRLRVNFGIGTKYIEHSNPYNKNSQRAVWSSLKRLASVVVEITNSDGHHILGHILDGAEEIEGLEDSESVWVGQPENLDGPAFPRIGGAALHNVRPRGVDRLEKQAQS